MTMIKQEGRRSPTDRQPRCTEVLNVRMTEAQRAEIVRQAVELGMSLSDVVRTRIFGSLDGIQHTEELS